jgi:hypothetical protein
MRGRAAIFWHAALSGVAGVLYFFFVLPRWPELIGDTSHGLGTAARIAAGVLIALAALPVVFTLLELRKPEFGTPALALTLRTWSVVAHVTAGVLIVGTAISEIWLSLDSVGPWLFGVYGAAAAIALLGIAGFYLSFVAESPPPPPKPLKAKKDKKERRQRRRRGKQDGDAADAVSDAEADDTDAEAADPETDVAEASEDNTEAGTTTVVAESTTEDPAAVEDAEAADETEADESGGLRNRRPSGKGSGTHRRRRSRRGVAVDE